jgi:adenylosuccinate synthase
MIEETILVARTFPIRVAGNSGPLYGEVTWQWMSDKLGKTVEERTTVTNKVRRIGRWDPYLFQQAVLLNKPTSIALTFLDYLNPANEGAQSMSQLTPDTLRFIDNVEADANAPVSLLGTGGPRCQIIDRRVKT